MDLLIATANPNKAREVGQILLGLPYTIHTLAEFRDVPEVIEDGVTFAENALIKARAYCKFTNMLALADDSGLMVDALDGAPGIHSARYAGEGATGEDLCAKLLAELKNVPTAKRTAHFHCTLALVSPEGWEQTVDGRVDGVITTEMFGNEGFGYDPVFYYPPLKKTFAAASAAEKNKISHRALALDKLKTILTRLPL